MEECHLNSQQILIVISHQRNQSADIIQAGHCLQLSYEQSHKSTFLCSELNRRLSPASFLSSLVKMEVRGLTGSLRCPQKKIQEKEPRSTSSLPQPRRGILHDFILTADSGLTKVTFHLYAVKQLSHAEKRPYRVQWLNCVKVVFTVTSFRLGRCRQKFVGAEGLWNIEAGDSSQLQCSANIRSSDTIPITVLSCAKSSGHDGKIGL